MGFFMLLAFGAGLLLVPILLVSVWILVQYIYYKEHLNTLEKARHDWPNPQDGPDVIVVGAGVVGSVMATILARDGRKVTVIERTAKPVDRVAGESILAACLLEMKKLDLEIPFEEIEANVADAIIFYPREGEDKKPVTAPLDPIAINARNEKFVEALWKRLKNEKGCSFVQGNVENLLEENGVVTGVVYRSSEDEEKISLRAPLTVVVDGSHSRLRSTNVIEKAVPCCNNISLEVECKVDTAFSIISTSLGQVMSFCMSPTHRRIILSTNVKCYKRDLLAIAKEFPEPVRDDYRKSVENGPIRNSPLVYLTPNMKHVPGVITIGDALSVRSNMTASGMSVGMKDVSLWRSLLKGIPDLHNHEAMFAAENAFAVRRKKYSFLIDLFARCTTMFLLRETAGLKMVGEAYADYVTTIPKDFANMFSGVDTRPQLVLYHLAKVTMISTYRAFTSKTWYGLPCGFYKAGLAFWSANTIIMPHIWSEITSMIVKK